MYGLYGLGDTPLVESFDVVGGAGDSATLVPTDGTQAGAIQQSLSGWLSANSLMVTVGCVSAVLLLVFVGGLR